VRVCVCPCAWMVGSAPTGDAHAIFNLGFIHLKGMGVPRNYTAARQAFEKAAALGLGAAHNG
jgi:TPR repeat protein